MKVLVVVDMQNDFINGTLGTPEAQKIVPNVVAKIEEYTNIPLSRIFVTMDTHDSNYLKTQEGKNLPVFHCINHTVGWMFNPQVGAALSNTLYTRIVKSTFGSEDLVSSLNNLRKRFITNEDPMFEVELVGLCTDICVVSNAIMIKNMLAYDNVTVTVDARCCAGVTPESHQAALTTMKMCQINIIEQ